MKNVVPVTLSTYSAKARIARLMRSLGEGHTTPAREVMAYHAYMGLVAPYDLAVASVEGFKKMMVGNPIEALANADEAIHAAGIVSMLSHFIMTMEKKAEDLASDTAFAQVLIIEIASLRIGAQREAAMAMQNFAQDANQSRAKMQIQRSLTASWILADETIETVANV